MQIPKLPRQIPKLSRRSILALGAAAGVVLVAATTAAWKGSAGAIAEDIVRQALPGVRFDPEGLRQFRADEEAMQDPSLIARIKRRAYVPLRAFAHVAPGLTAEPLLSRVQQLERYTVSRFLQGSDFFRIDPETDVVTYTGYMPSACANPFKRMVEA